MKKFAWIAAAIATGCAATPTTQQPAAAQAPEGRPAGYLASGAAPNSLTLLPAPPQAGSAAQARDDDASKDALAMSGGPRWRLATEDAELGFPQAAETFSCSLGVKVSPETTPRLYTLLRRSLADAGMSTYPTKNKYKRQRPFMVNHAPICTPAIEARLRNDGSYPSGHSAIGWAWALILAEAAPDRADAVLARGRAFSQSRVVCNVHWQSDVDEGRTMGAAAVAKLHDDATFRADLDAARAEITAARVAGHLPTRDCGLETAGLAAG
ncbi:MAG TPA: phosphatase PAP2 family protein [Phenylobacterium sp.]|uniref:acid phosphatase n=1 Tax=Phenylobacterium sp. TaxID=1871053 RepID=UPI002F91C114